MAIGRKATKQKTQDVDIDALIEKGGSHAGDGDTSPLDDVQKITVRLPKDLVRRIDEAIKQRPISISRNQWLAEAAYEALKGRGEE
ncbi:MAG: hypothetical protein E2O74_00535 [Chloroflexi bacterium]|nr:hypothetical protein [Nitrospirota bacterium]TDI86961.1 MAG: hypothetical protein E2O74_00535 [Chloroflexota bacterium]